MRTFLSLLLPLLLYWTGHTRADCSSPSNHIVRENCLPGSPSTEWDVNGDGDPTIQGFTTDISINVGETVFFKVKTPSSKWRIDIYRMGYYNGNGARLVTTIQPRAALPQMQPACFKEEATHLVDCNTWAVSAMWKIPSNSTSGLYFGRLVREDPLKEEYAQDGVNWRADNSFRRGDLLHARPGNSDYEPPTKDYHAYGATGFGKLRNPIRGM